MLLSLGLCENTDIGNKRLFSFFDIFILKVTLMKICGIYSVTNKINNKIYIGQSIDIERRWQQHKYGKGNLILKNAIKKYGIENFEFSILEQIDTVGKTKIEIVKILTEAEQKWFDKINPFIGENGYNIQRTSKPNLTKSRDEDFGKKISKIKIDNNHTGKPIIQYNLNGIKLKEWKSSADVERVLGFKAENISACLLKKSKQSNGFIWRFKDDKISSDDIACLSDRKKPIKRKIHQITTDNKIIKTWNSLKELVMKSEFDNRPVKDCCNGKRLIYKGFKWSWVE